MYFVGAITAVVYVTAVALFIVLCIFNLIVWVLFMFMPEPPHPPRHAAPKNGHATDAREGPRDWTPAHESQKEEL